MLRAVEQRGRTGVVTWRSWGQCCTHIARGTQLGCTPTCVACIAHVMCVCVRVYTHSSQSLVSQSISILHPSWGIMAQASVVGLFSEGP